MLQETDQLESSKQDLLDEIDQLEEQKSQLLAVLTEHDHSGQCHRHAQAEELHIDPWRHPQWPMTSSRTSMLWRHLNFLSKSSRDWERVAIIKVDLNTTEQTKNLTP